MERVSGMYSGREPNGIDGERAMENIPRHRAHWFMSNVGNFADQFSYGRAILTDSEAILHRGGNVLVSPCAVSE